jgi:Flp pilus assembly pilin Flp
MEAKVVKRMIALLGKKGTSAIEYTIIAAVISMAIVVGATSIGQRLWHLYNVFGNSIPKQ